MKNVYFLFSKTKLYGLNFITHRGAQEHLEPGESKLMPLVEEPMSDEEIVSYYDVRYKSLGLETKIQNDGSLEEKKPVNAIEEAIKDKVVEPSKVSSIKVEEEPKVKEPEPAEEVVEETSEVSKEETVEDVESWDMNKLRDFVRKNNIRVSGKGKEAFVNAVSSFLEK